MSERDEVISKYRNFFWKFSCPIVEARRARLSSILSQSFLQERQSAERCLNASADLVQLMRQRDTSNGVMHEALIATYPTSVFERRVLQAINSKLPDELKSLRMCDIAPTKSEKLVVDDVECRDFSDDGKVASIVVFKFPVFQDSKELAEDIARAIVDDAAFCGYFLAQEEYEQVWKKPIAGKTILLCYMTFEAKYAKIDFELNAQLFHVTDLSSLKKINANGILPKSKSPIFKYPERTYLFSNCDMVDISQFAIDKVGTDAQFALLKIDANMLQDWEGYKSGKIRFYVDSKLSSLDNKKLRAIFTYEGIPRKLLDPNVTIFTVDPRSWRPTLVKHAHLKDF